MNLFSGSLNNPSAYRPLLGPSSQWPSPPTDLAEQSRRFAELQMIQGMIDQSQNRQNGLGARATLPDGTQVQCGWGQSLHTDGNSVTCALLNPVDSYTPSKK